MTFDQRFLDFLIYFNRDRDYFECHEVMEELWLASGSDPLYKGLLQVAVGLFHFRSGNRRGSLMMFQSALEKLAPFPEDSLGIELGRLKTEVFEYAARLAAYKASAFSYYDLTIEIRDPALREAVRQRESGLKPNSKIQLVRQRGPKHELRGKDRT